MGDLHPQTSLQTLAPGKRLTRLVLSINYIMGYVSAPGRRKVGGE